MSPSPARQSWANTFVFPILLLSQMQCAHSIELPLLSNNTSCQYSTPGTHMLVTADCTDPKYPSVVIDDETEETSPAPHHKVSAHFDGTDIGIRLYFPPSDEWEGRFFHYVYPSNPTEASDRHVSFALASGGYMVQITGTNGYRADAAAAKFSRSYASAHYDNTDHIYGYIFGGSGGSFQTVGAAENTIGVWDGSIPIIQAVPVSLPDDICARALGGLAFGDKAGEIIDAVRPGGSGDPFAVLDPTQKAVLREVTDFGVTLAAWEDFDQVARADSLVYLMSDYKAGDPTYKDDFFSLPGYLGTDSSPLGDKIRAAWVNTTQTVTEVVVDSDNNPTKLILDHMPTITNTNGLHALEYTLLAANGTTNSISGTLNTTDNAIYLTAGQSQTLLDSISPASSRIHMENSWFIAMSSFHRHQVPPASMGFPTFDQFRDPTTGEPIPVQRRPILSINNIHDASGGSPTHTGNMTGSGKMIVLDNLLDSDAYPAHADWYKNRVRTALGNDTLFDESYRLYYTESANHNFGAVTPSSKTTMLIDFTGVIEQALRDLANWVEKGIEPPTATNYTISGGQVEVPQSAADRKGFQATVSLDVAAEEGANNGKGEAAKYWDLKAHIEVPRGAGKVVAVQWDPLGKGEFAGYQNATTTTDGKDGGRDEPLLEQMLDVTLRYDGYAAESAGTYFPTVRVVTQREGNKQTPFARVLNLGRARVTV